MKRKKGFVSMSLIYAFFIAFVAIMLAVLATYAQNRVLNNAINEDIMENIADNRETLCDYEENEVVFNRSLDPSEGKLYNEVVANGQIHGQLKLHCNGYYQVELTGHSGDDYNRRGHIYRGGKAGSAFVVMNLNSSNELVYNLNKSGPSTVSYLYKNTRVPAITVTNGIGAGSRSDGPDGNATFSDENFLLYQQSLSKYNLYSKIVIKYLGKDVPKSSDVIKDGFVYGIRRNIEAKSSSFERLNDSLNLTANAQVGTTPVRNDFDNIYPWSDIKTYSYNTVTGEKVWIDEEGFTFSPGENWEILTYIPEFFYKREVRDGYEYIYISPNSLEGYTKSEAFSVGRYMIDISYIDSLYVAHSRNGLKPRDSETITTFRNSAKALNKPGSSEFGIMDYHYFILQLLYLVEYADYNSQAMLGPGNTENSYALKNGEITNGVSTNDFGMKSGSVDGTASSAIIYRGIENIFGNVWQFIDGINIKDRRAYICLDQKEYEINKYDGCYQPLSYTKVNDTGYITRLGYDANNPLISLPTDTKYGTPNIENNYITDYNYGSEGLIITVGGAYYSRNYAGLWFTFFGSEWDYSGNSIGARLIKLETE